MIKLNLLPASYQQKGTVKTAAIAVLVVWVVLLIVLFIYATKLLADINSEVAQGDHWTGNKGDISVLNTAKTQYDLEYSKIKPETEFLNATVQQPAEFQAVMTNIARATTSGVVIEKYTVTPASTTVPITAWVKDFPSYRNWQFTLYKDPDFPGLPQQMSPPKVNGVVLGGSSTSTPGAPAAAPPPTTPTAGAGATVAAATSFNYPVNQFPQAFPVTVNLTLAKAVSLPTFSAAAAVAPAGGPGGMPPGPGPPGAPGAAPPGAGPPGATPPPK